jgi:hypothetical protein
VCVSCKEKPAVVKLEGIINFITGDVIIKSSSGESKAKVGDSVAEGVTVKTGSGSVVDIYFNENVIRILEKSTVEIREFFQEAGSGKEFTGLYVEKGKVFSRVAKKLAPGEKYQVTTKTTVAGVRGTEFLVEDSDEGSRIACIEGAVAVKKVDEDDSKLINLEAGNEAVLDKDKKLNVRELKGKNKENIRKIRDEIKEMRKDIRDKFEKQREEIKKQVSDLKQAAKEKVAEQKAQDKENVKSVKEESKAKSEEIKGEIDDKKTEAKGAVEEFKKPDIKGVKPDIKKLGNQDNQ